MNPSIGGMCFARKTIHEVNSRPVTVPSEAEHQILLQTLTDVMGFKQIIDHLQVEALLRQTKKRAREVGPEIITRWQEPPGTEDIIESAEEGKEFVAPAKPTSSEE